jgi:hypothetical protein
MLEFEPNTLAFMTASLEQACKQLKVDTPEARKFIANKLKECARRGRISQLGLTEAAEEAVTQLNNGISAQGMGGWRALLQWMIPSWRRSTATTGSA